MPAWPSFLGEGMFRDLPVRGRRGVVTRRSGRGTSRRRGAGAVGSQGLVATRDEAASPSPAGGAVQSHALIWTARAHAGIPIRRSGTDTLPFTTAQPTRCSSFSRPVPDETACRPCPWRPEMRRRRSFYRRGQRVCSEKTQRSDAAPTGRSTRK